MKQLRQYIRQILKENFGGSTDITHAITPPPPKEHRISELDHIRFQMENPYNSDDLQEDLDKDFESLFIDLLELHGIKENKENIVEIIKGALPPIKKLKNHYKIERPQVLADKVDFDLKSHQDDMASAQTKSYPSGHACQAYLVAMILAERYPHLRDALLHLAECVAQSRVDRGVHFPSDLAGGVELANFLFYERMRNRP